MIKCSKSNYKKDNKIWNLKERLNLNKSREEEGKMQSKEDLQKFIKHKKPGGCQGIVNLLDTDLEEK